MHPIFKEIRKQYQQLLDGSQTLHSFSFSVEYMAFVKEEKGAKKLYYLLVVDGLPKLYDFATDITPDNNVSHRWEAEQVSEHLRQHLARDTRQQALLLISEALRNFYETHRDFYRKEETVISESDWEKELIDATLEMSRDRARGLQWLSSRLRSRERTDLIMRYRHRRGLFAEIKRHSKDSYLRAPRRYTREHWANNVWRAEAKRKYPHLFSRYPDIIFELGNDPGFTAKDAALASLSQDTSIPVASLDRRFIRGASLKKRTKSTQNSM